MRLSLLRSITVFIVALSCAASNAQGVVYQGEQGAGQGKHIVFLAGDHEYRSEETLPALARILAKWHGFKCTVLITTDPQSGEIEPGSSWMPGTDALKDADLMVIFLRFQDLPPEQMQPIVDYLQRGGPVVGLRTSTHAFKIPKDSPYARFDHQYAGDEFANGFGRQVLGETWVSHYGQNHVMSTRLDIVEDLKSHPILRGVQRPWADCGGYWTDPQADSTVLALAQPLQGMTPDAPVAADKDPCPGVWIRSYTGSDGREGRVFTTTYGASKDLLNDDFRRLLINGCFWAAGLEQAVDANLDIRFVGPFQPSSYSFGGHRKGIKPGDLSGWETPIMPLAR